MEVEEIERQQQQQQKNPSKFSRVGSNRNESTKLCHHYGENSQEEDGLDLIKRPNYSNPLNNGVNDGNNNNNNINSIISSSINDHLCGWHHSSRIIRVSRASGGKDRHSKVWTSKGSRDRRVRLSVSTAIQFYDLQDRLGFDQPSKAVEWLIKAAADSIAELPKLNSSFPLETSLGCQLSDDQKRREQLEAPLDSGEADVDNVEQESNQQGLGLGQQQQQHGSLMSKSACSSTSETSKGSGLSLSRGDTRVNRVKARERARERTAKEKEKEKEKESELNRVNSNVQQHQHQNISHMSQNSTFTELLTAGISNSNHHSGSGESGSPNDGSTEVTLFHKVAAAAARQWPLTPMDCFGGSGMLGGGTPAGSGRTGFPGQIQLGNSLPQGMTMSMLVPQQPTPFSISIGGYNNSNNSHHHHHNHHHHQLEQLQHFPFVPDLILPVAAAAGSGGGGGGQGGDYNLNFTISSSSGLAAGFNRGTLQSNSSSPTSSPQHSISTHLQRYSSASANAAASSSPMDGSTNNIPFFIDTSATTTTAMENHHNHQHHHQFPPGLQLLYGDGRHSDHKGKGKS